MSVAGLNIHIVKFETVRMRINAESEPHLAVKFLNIWTRKKLL